MKFRGGSNVNSYITAGAAAAKQADQAFATIKSRAPDYAGLAKTSIKNRSNERVAAMKAQAAVEKAGIEAKKGVKRTKITEDAKKDILDTKIGAKRFAGIVGGLGTIAVAGIGLADNDKEDNSWKDKYHQKEMELLDKQIAALDKPGREYPTYERSEFKYDGGSTDSSGSGSSGTGGKGGKAPGGSTLTGGAKTVADAIAKYESGDWGYEAFNQGGAAGGTKVLGKSGNHKATFGRSLTDMTLGEIFQKQNTKAQGMSFDEHVKSGGLHAVGRYQFIGSTLQDEVSRMGLSHDTKFTPEVQDQIFLSHIKRVGNISPWVGPMNNYNDSEKANFNSIIKGL